MKKFLPIIILGLLWCNVGFAETEESIESIEKKYRGTLPECEGGVSDLAKDKLSLEWNNCFGILKIQDIVFHSGFVDGNMIGKGTWSDDQGVKLFIEVKGNGNCKRSGYALTNDGRFFKVKFNKDCVPISQKEIK